MTNNIVRHAKIGVLILAVALVAAACNNNSNPTSDSNSQSTASTQSVDNSNPSTTPVTPTPTASTTTPSNPAPSTPAPNPTPSAPAPTPSPTSTPHVDNFAVTANDYTATPAVVNVKKGDTVNLKLIVSTENVYYGGLDFRSDIVNSGSILPGANETVTFTADSSFTIHCFWPSSGNERQSQIQINVS